MAEVNARISLAREIVLIFNSKTWPSESRGICRCRPWTAVLNWQLNCNSDLTEQIRLE